MVLSSFLFWMYLSFIGLNFHYNLDSISLLLLFTSKCDTIQIFFSFYASDYLFVLVPITKFGFEYNRILL